MIIKNMDEHSAELAAIERHLLSDPPKPVAEALLRDKSNIQGNLEHKRTAAYHLDFYFTDTQDWVLLHDLRLEMGDVSATIDHLLISRELDVYVIEAKHYNARVMVNENGEFFYYVDNRPLATDSPAERNHRNIDFLASYLVNHGLLPTRFGMSIRPNFHSIVLLSPDSTIELPRRNIDLRCEVVRSDQLMGKINRKLAGDSAVHDFVALARQVSPENLRALAETLARRHIPHPVDFSRRYGIDLLHGTKEQASDGVTQCAGCNKRITARVVRYCYDNLELFSGKAYCFDCQKGIVFKAVM